MREHHAERLKARLLSGKEKHTVNIAHSRRACILIFHEHLALSKKTSWARLAWLLVWPIGCTMRPVRTKTGGVVP